MKRKMFFFTKYERGHTPSHFTYRPSLRILRTKINFFGLKVKGFKTKNYKIEKKKKK